MAIEGQFARPAAVGGAPPAVVEPAAAIVDATENERSMIFSCHHFFWTAKLRCNLGNKWDITADSLFKRLMRQFDF